MFASQCFCTISICFLGWTHLSSQCMHQLRQSSLYLSRFCVCKENHCRGITISLVFQDTYTCHYACLTDGRIFYWDIFDSGKSFFRSSYRFKIVAEQVCLFSALCSVWETSVRGSADRIADCSVAFELSEIFDAVRSDPLFVIHWLETIDSFQVENYILCIAATQFNFNCAISLGITFPYCCRCNAPKSR